MEKKLFYLGLAVLPLLGIVYYFWENVLYLVWPFQTCIWDKMFGIYCPGCGGTRALKAFLQGEFLVSLWYHPLVFYGFVVYGFFMVSQLLAMISRGKVRGLRFRSWYLYLALVILVVNCFAKNYLRIRHGITI